MEYFATTDLPKEPKHRAMTAKMSAYGVLHYCK